MGELDCEINVVVTIASSSFPVFQSVFLYFSIIFLEIYYTVKNAYNSEPRKVYDLQIPLVKYLYKDF